MVNIAQLLICCCEYACSESIVAQMEALFSRAASTVLVNIVIDGLDDLDALEVCFHVSALL